MVTSVPDRRTHPLPIGTRYSFVGTTSCWAYKSWCSMNTTGLGSLMADFNSPFTSYGCGSNNFKTGNG